MPEELAFLARFFVFTCLQNLFINVVFNGFLILKSHFFPTVALWCSVGAALWPSLNAYFLKISLVWNFIWFQTWREGM